MNEITLAPLIKFFNSLGRPYIYRAELAQLEAKIQRTRQKKLAASAPGKKVITEQEDEYLRLLAAVTKLLPPAGRIPQKKVIAHLSKLMKAAGYDYKKLRRGRAYANAFADKNRGTRLYDLAFFSPQCNNFSHVTRPHHTHKDQPGIFYMRCEEATAHPEEITFGNLQIETGWEGDWDNPAMGKVLRKRKNLYREMVQQAVKHALKGKKTRIRFHAGSAVEYAQWGTANLRPITLRPEELAACAARHQAKLTEFDRVTPGQNFPDDRQIVMRTAPGEIITVPTKALNRYLLQGLFNNVGDHWELMLPGMLTPLRAAHRHFNQKAPGKFLTALAKVFDSFESPRLSAVAAAQRDAQLTAVRTLCAAQPPGACSPEDFARQLEPFLEKFGYVDAFLREVPRAARSEFHGMRYYHKKALPDDEYSYTKKELPRPHAGRLMMLPGNVFAEPDLGATFKMLHRGAAFKQEICRWYEKDLPEELTRLGLTIKKVKVATNQLERPETRAAEMWEISAGLEEFAKKPLTRFATPTQPKLDLVSLAELTTAAQKFNLRPEQLRVINEWVGSSGVAAQYDSVRQQVTLGSPSLALLAHEGWHHLVAAGLVPPREYAAVIAAGRRLAAEASSPLAAANTVAPGPAREEEYGALFVEAYYETPGRARRQLQGAKISVLEKLLNYAQALCDVLWGVCGHQPAQARNFLRRIEQNQLAAAPARPRPRGFQPDPKFIGNYGRA